MAAVTYNGQRASFRERLAGFLLKGGGSPLPMSMGVGNAYGPLEATFFEPNSRNLMRQGYKQNSAVFSCVGAYADAFAEAPLVVYDAPPEDGGKKQPNHPVQKLLRSPNPNMGEDSLWRMMIVYAGFGGNCYFQKVRNSAGVPIALYPYHDVRMSAISGRERWIDHYEYKVDENTIQTLAPTEVVHYAWIVDPAKPWQGMSPLMPVAREVDTDSELTRYLKALLENDAVARGFLKLPDGVMWDEEKRKKAKQQWKLEMGGSNRGDIAIMSGGLSYERVSLNLQELAFDALRGVPEARIASAYRVPPIVAGLNIGLARSTFANYAEARMAFTEQTISPRWANVAAQTQISLAPDFGNDFYLAYDTSRVSAFAAGNLAKRQAATEEYQAGGISLNEYREALGKEPIPGGDVLVDGTPVAGGQKRNWRGVQVKAASAQRKIEKRIKADMQELLGKQYEAMAARVEAA